MIEILKPCETSFKKYKKGDIASENPAVEKGWVAAGYAKYTDGKKKSTSKKEQ